MNVLANPGNWCFSDHFMAHGYCYLWNPALVTLHVVSDGAITLAYLVIPLALTYIVLKRKDIPFSWMLCCFGAFIIACGTTHAMEIWTLWHGDYWISGIIKAFTGIVSLITSVLLIRLLPTILTLPSAHMLRVANEALEKEAKKRQQVENELREKNLELQKANLAKDNFLASMSHELRTPLNAIIGFSGTLAMRLQGPLTPTQEKHIDIIKSSAKHLLSLINDLLDLTKIESGKIAIQHEKFSCQQLVEDLMNVLELQAKLKGLTFTAVMPEQEIILNSDKRAISQIILNLASNALKFTQTGGVRLELSKQIEDKKAYLKVDVIDTGIGIRAEDQQRLFNAFEQVHNNLSTEGTGLGLYLSKKFSALLGGSIQFSSEIGKGSCFTLRVPLE